MSELTYHQQKTAQRRLLGHHWLQPGDRVQMRQRYSLNEIEPGAQPTWIKFEGWEATILEVTPVPNQNDPEQIHVRIELKTKHPILYPAQEGQPAAQRFSFHTSTKEGSAHYWELHLLNPMTGDEEADESEEACAS